MIHVIPSAEHNQDEAMEEKVQGAAGSTSNAEKADGGRYEIEGTMELYLTCPKSQLAWAFDVRLIVRFERFVVRK